MENTSAVHDVRRPSGGSEPSAAPRDLRDWLARAEAIGQITRIREPIDWNEEMGAITYMAHQAIGAPAPWSRTSKGAPGDSRPRGTSTAPASNPFRPPSASPPGPRPRILIRPGGGKCPGRLPR